MTTTPFVPVPIIFGDKYEGDKLRRLADSFNTLATRVAALGKSSGSNSVPTGGTVGQVLTRIGTGYGWANPAPPTGSIPYSSLTGVPTSFAPALHLIASPTGLGSAHAIQAPGPGSVLVATGTTTAVMAPLLYSQLGDVDTSAISAGRIPQWNGSKWAMVDPGGSYVGLTIGTVLTATSPTSAVFQPITPASITGVLGTAQLGVDPAQYGLGMPLAPLLPQHGTQYAQLNEPSADDSVLAGDGRWKAIRDIGISWSQLSDVPAVALCGSAISWTSNHVFRAPASGPTLTLFAGPGGGTDALRIRGADNQRFANFNSITATGSGYYFGLSQLGVDRAWIGLGSIIVSGAASGDLGIVAVTGTMRLAWGGASTTAVSIAQGGNVTVAAPSSGTAFTIAGGGISVTGNAGFFGAAPVAQVTGYGTPTGGSHQGSFAAGSITLPNLAAAVAQLIIDLKSYGWVGA